MLILIFVHKPTLSRSDLNIPGIFIIVAYVLAMVNLSCKNIGIEFSVVILNIDII